MTLRSSKKILRPLVGNLIRRSPLRWHIPNKVTRMGVIQRAIDILGAQKYLEIGVSSGINFCTVTAPEKIGVDPISPSPAVLMETSKSGVCYFAHTSDDFFEQVAPQLLTGGVDVVFIDGLHTYEQAYRDCLNSLRYLNSGGLILLHDCLPTSELEARVADNFEDATKLNTGMARNYNWVGDVWKAILRLRTEHMHLMTCVLHCDHGIGLVYRAQNECGLSLTMAQIDAMTYADLASDAKRLLGLRKPSHLMAVLGKLRLEPRRVVWKPELNSAHAHRRETKT